LRSGFRLAATNLGRVVETALLRSGQRQLGLTWRALQDRGPEQSGRVRRNEVVAHRYAARRFTRHRDLVGVTTEPGDIVTHPAQRRLLVGEAVVANVPRRAEGRMGQKAQRTESVVERDDDDVAPVRQLAGDVQAAATAGERAAVDPHHHRTVLVVRRRRPYVQRQAVLVGLPAHLQITARILHASRPGARRVADALPRRDRGGRLPAQRADRWCPIRDSREQSVIRGDDATHHAGGGLHHRRIRRDRRLRRFTVAAATGDRQQHAEGKSQQAVKRSGRHKVRA
jgi:hypothetical protein